MDTVPISLIMPIVKAILSDWNELDINYYFEMAYRDQEMSLYVSTNDRQIARQVASQVTSRMRELQRKNPNKAIQ